jgi:hypothetical protein
MSIGALFAMMVVVCPVLAQTGPYSDHYLSYRVEPQPRPTPIIVGDQFIPQLQAEVLELQRLLNPVRQNGAAFVDSTAHLDWWRILPNVSIGQQIAVVNKFGQGTWFIENLEFLLAPSRKNDPAGIPLPDNINHFLCYRAQSSTPLPTVPVRLEDQFRQIEVLVGPPRYFCAPCRKRHDTQEYPIVDPEVHFAVYEVIPPTFTAPVMLYDQFGIFQTLVVSPPPEYLFVPSYKDEPVPVEPSTWGRIKGTYGS